MLRTITDYAEFLVQARQAVEELSLLKDREKKLISEERRLERELEAQNKHTNDTIQQTARKRMEEINSSYDKQIAKGQERLKKEHQKREKAKSQGVHARIKEETKELHVHNQELKTKMKVLFQQKHVPSFCKRGAFYSLYFPRGIKEYLCLIVWMAICFGGIPCGIYYMFTDHHPWQLALIYVAAILLFGGTYVAVGNKTKMRHGAALKEGRIIRDTIQSNQKKIRVITTTIRRDRDEAGYDLGKYDDGIAQAEQELLEITTKKKEAINTFENVTKTILAEEIESNNQPKLAAIQNDYEAAIAELRETQTLVKEKSLEIADTYEPYLGTEFLDSIKISELAGLLQNESAKNLTEAMDLYREKNKQ